MDIENFFSDDFGQTIVRFFICLLVNWSIIEFFYYRKSNRRDFYFTFVLMTVAIFFLVFQKGDESINAHGTEPGKPYDEQLREAAVEV